MKQISWLLGILLFLSPLQMSAQKQDTVAMRETRIPVLIERQDNELFNLRIDATQSQVLNDVKLSFGKEVNLNEIEAVKLYYGGTESSERKGKTYFAPVDYIPSNTPGKTLAANPSYSILKAEVKAPKRDVVLKVDQKLYPGVNYFWVSLQMKPTASVLAKVSVEMTGVTMDNRTAPVKVVRKADTHYMGVGVRHAGDDGVAAYRIPGLATSNKGTLLGVYDVRHNNSADLQEYVEIGLSRSTDGGQTWEKMRIPMSFGEHEGLPKAQNGVGDPAILVDRKTGTIWIIAAWTHGMGNGRAWWNSQPGMDMHHTAQLMLVKSDDDGKTWSEPINITEQVKDPSWYFLLQGPGRGISMDDGTLVFASQYIGSDRIPNAGIIYSKDHGKTWMTSNPAYSNVTECNAAQLSDGTVMLNMRDNRNRGNKEVNGRRICTTTDLGETWTEHSTSRKALVEPTCMASLHRHDYTVGGEKRSILLFANPSDYETRDKLTLKVSFDDGMTWPEKYWILFDQYRSAGYSSITSIDENSIGILYESSQANMAFIKIDLTEILNR